MLMFEFVLIYLEVCMVMVMYTVIEVSVYALIFLIASLKIPPLGPLAVPVCIGISICPIYEQGLG